MSSRVTRSRSQTPQTAVTDFFKTTRKPRARGEKKIIDESITKTTTIKEVQIPAAPIVENKSSRTRARTPSRQAELSSSGTPPKKAREAEAEAPELPKIHEDIILENPAPQKSAIDKLMEASGPAKKKAGIRTVADLQARIAAKGAAKAIHEQNLKNKTKQVDDHVELLKSPKKPVIVEHHKSPQKSKAARNLFSPKKPVPDYIIPGFNVLKSAEKVRGEQDDAHEEEGKRMTAEFLKSSRLIDEVKESARQRIELPTAYEHLADTFKRIDQITAIFIGQNRSCVVPELIKNVKNTSGKDFSNEHLSQILHVYPQSYHIEMREQRKAFGQGGKYELEVRPNLVEDLRGYIYEKSPTDGDTEDLPLVCPSKLLSPKKSPRKQVQPALRKPEVDGRIRLDAARQRDRAHVFRYKLASIVTKCHTEFLESQGLCASSNIKRMHPLFRLDKHCPSLPQVKLPEPPLQKSSIHIGMKEALDKYMDQVSLPSFVQKAYQDLKSPLKSTTGASGTVPISPKKFSEMQKEQKSQGAMSLLERIRAKEAIKKAAEACIDKDLERRKQRLTLLRDRYVRIVCNHYTAKRAQTMEIDVICKFVQFSSSNSSSIPDIMDHLRLLCEVAPMYISEASLMNKKYFRFTDNNIEAINELLDEELQITQKKIDEQRNTQIAQMSHHHTPRPSKAARSLKFH
ncbi:CDT1 Geminin-binding domain-containing protein [Caenorhabditis elegans]|uniref:CDT1 Geminin-binding domain-containing protein n=1 Tax=Caenorhabditis elegans TaxID=6239 RepID=Q86S68_CAEEL|nr:CDT1 Geminin-binding domain-containing protein [Caenorhabditis elegans]CCD72833.1 CDT1 Geminin-binding domain-containing protein [Caenorhabditis elegans]|eukprot:NP_001040707.1 CDT (S. pombe CDC10 Dependent Transcript) homolog [Caenorhabditis elegans]